MKLLNKLLYGLLALIILLILSAVVFSGYYEKKAKGFFIREVNKNLRAEVTFGAFNFSLLRKFPHASLLFTDLVMKDAIPYAPNDTLLSARKVFFQFSILDIIRDNYTLKRIDIEDGKLNLRVYQDGSENYLFWEGDETQNAGALNIKLDHISLQRVLVHYTNASYPQDYLLLINKANLKGAIYKSSYVFNARTESYVHHIVIDRTEYLRNKGMQLDAVLDVDQASGTYVFQKSRVDIGSLAFNAEGSVVHTFPEKFIDLTITGHKLNLASCLAELPDAYRKPLDKYTCAGKIDLTLEIKGSYNNQDVPGVAATYALANGSIGLHGSPVKLNRISLQGQYNNGPNRNLAGSTIDLSTFTATLNTGDMKGRLQLKNLEKPTIDLSAEATISLYDLLELFPSDTLASINGQVKLVLAFNGTVDNIRQLTAKDFLFNRIQGQMELDDVNFYFNNDHLRYNDIKGNLSFNNNDVLVKSLTGQISRSQIDFDGTLLNILPAMFLPNQLMQIKGQLRSSAMDLNELLSVGSSPQDTVYRLAFPEQLKLDVTADIGQLRFRKFKATGVKGHVQLKNGRLLVDPISLLTMNGQISGTGSLDASRPEDIRFTLAASAQNLDIQQLFDQCENFGQTNLTSQHLQGNVTSDFVVGTSFSSDLSIDQNSVFARAEILIEKGRLVNYKPLEALSRFIKLRDLIDVEFSTLHNTIEIKNRIVDIPAMEIKSSALNLKLKGRHTFNHEIDYKLQVLLSDILWNKARKSKQENEFYGIPIEEDGMGKTTLFLSVTGTVDDPAFRYDRQGVREKVRQEVRQETQSVKQILREEWGLFKKDSTLIKGSSGEKPTPRIIWDEQEDDDHEHELY